MAEPTVGNRLTTRFPPSNKKSIAIESETDWARLDAMTDADIDLSDCPEVTPEMFAGAVVRRSVNNRAKVTVTITSRRGYANDSETLPDRVGMF